VAAPSETVLLARLAKESGLFPVFTARHGEVSEVLPIRHRVPVEDYLQRQGRYRHLFYPQRRDDVIERIQAMADANVARYGLAQESQGGR
jgi:pyruvate ferredoxin oxidoreductase beta subunit